MISAAFFVPTPLISTKTVAMSEGLILGSAAAYGIALKAYNDAWEALSKMPELIELLGKIDRGEREPTVKEFAEMLKELGYKDITERPYLPHSSLNSPSVPSFS